MPYIKLDYINNNFKDLFAYHDTKLNQIKYYLREGLILTKIDFSKSQIDQVFKSNPNNVHITDIIVFKEFQRFESFERLEKCPKYLVEANRDSQSVVFIAAKRWR